MNRVFLLLVATILIAGLILSSGCAKATEYPYRIDREITGQVIAIDNQGEFSTLYFSDDLTIEITNSSLDHWLIRNTFKNVWTYKLQATFIKNRYDLVGINDESLPSPSVREEKK
ncbi:MAG: hypothetical protein V3U84_00870 [Thiotrichaceae bacterium]